MEIINVMAYFIKILFLFILIFLTFQGENPYKIYSKNIPFKMPEIKIPKFPNYSINIKDFGAIGDGKTLCTLSFMNAINTLYEKGGGKLIIPSGEWLTGPIQLKSNIDLHLEFGAIIQFSPDEKLYPIINTSYEGIDTYRCQSPISAINATNIAITGNGVIDGNGDYWRPVKKSHLSNSQWNKIKKRKNGLIISNKYWVPDEGFLLAENKEYYNKLKYINNITELNLYKRFLRPVLLSLRNCKNIFLKGVIFQNSPVWNIHILMSENIIIDRILVKNPIHAYYGDGIDIDSSKNALIINSTFDVGDDGICIKSGKYGKKENLLSENIIVDGCTFFSGHAGFAIGSEISGGAKNIKVSNCQFLGTENGLKFKSDKGKGALVEKIYIENISMKDIVNYVIIFDMNYNTKNISKEFINENNKTLENKNDENIPCFRNISIKDLYCNGAKQAMKFNGLSEFPINDILFKNIYIIANNVSEFNETKNIIQENVNITIN